jgi:hypothetical protein
VAVVAVRVVSISAAIASSASSSPASSPPVVVILLLVDVHRDRLDLDLGSRLPRARRRARDQIRADAGPSRCRLCVAASTATGAIDARFSSRSTSARECRARARDVANRERVRMASILAPEKTRAMHRPRVSRACVYFRANARTISYSSDVQTCVDFDRPRMRHDRDVDFLRATRANRHGVTHAHDD